MYDVVRAGVAFLGERKKWLDYMPRIVRDDGLETDLGELCVNRLLCEAFCSVANLDDLPDVGLDGD